MSIGTVSAHAADRGLAAPATRRREEAEREPAVATADLYATTTANTQALIGALGQNGAEAKRLNNLVAAAKAAAVQLVTAPVEDAPTEKVKTVAELLDRARFRARANPQEPEAVETKSVTRSPAPTTPAAPPAGAPGGAEASDPDAPVAEGPATPPIAPEPPVAEEPAPPPAAPEPPVAEEPATPPTQPQPPVAEEPAPQPTEPPVAEEPAPSPTEPPATTPPVTGGSGGGLGGVIGGLGGVVGGLMGRR